MLRLRVLGAPCRTFRPRLPRRCGAAPGGIVVSRIVERIRAALVSLWRRITRGSDEQRKAKARVRFWAELREGEREAEARSKS